MPMKNGDLDSKGFLASIVRSEGTVESFKVLSFLFLRKKRKKKKIRTEVYHCNWMCYHYMGDDAMLLLLK